MMAWPGWTAAKDARLRQAYPDGAVTWADLAAALGMTVDQCGRRAGFLGLGRRVDAIAGRPGGTHRRCQGCGIRFAGARRIAPLCHRCGAGRRG